MAVLYTPAVLGLAIDLARWPLDPEFALTGEARSTTCGSSIVMGLSCDGDDRINNVGVRAQACAIGQAAAALFAEAAPGRSRTDIADAHAALTRWLGGADELPDWPGLATIAPAQAYPARHGAIVLPWTAALAALPTG